MLRKTTILRLQHIFEQAINQKVFPGGIVGIISKTDRVVIPFGRYTYAAESPKVSEESIFDVASITKTVPTSLLAFQLLEERKISLDDKVNKYLPKFQGKHKNEVTILDLMTQTVDYGVSLSDFKHKSPKEIIDVILTSDLKNPPGKKYCYTNSSSILLGMIIEGVSKKSLEKLAKEKLFKPLKMRNTAFSPAVSDLVVPTEIDPWRKAEVKGFVHDESAYVLSKEGFVGSAGLFSTVPDLLNVLQMFINDGKFKNKRVFDKETLNLMQKKFKIGQNIAGLGWERNPNYLGKNYPSMLSKTGFTGCFFAFDSSKKLGLVMLSNYHYPKRKKDFNSLNKIRRLFIEETFKKQSN